MVFNAKRDVKEKTGYMEVLSIPIFLLKDIL